MFDVGGGELLLIILVILLLFGPEKLPEFTKTINKGLKKVKQAQSQFQSQINEIQTEINSSLDVDAQIPKADDFKPIPPNDSKIGAFDQLDLDKNFIAEPIKKDTHENESSQDDNQQTPDNDNIEKINTKKNSNSQSSD